MPSVSKPPAMPGDFGYEDGDLLYPVPDWLVKSTFLDVPEPPNLSLGSSLKDRGACSSRKKKACFGRPMTAILEDASEDEECCPDDAMDVDEEEDGSRLGLQRYDKPFPSLAPVCAEHQLMFTDSCALEGVCDQAWARPPTLAKPMHTISQEFPYPAPAESCCVTSVGKPQQPLSLGFSGALQPQSSTDPPSVGYAGLHLGQCQP